MAIVECVPNISEGRDLAKVKAVTDAVAGIPGCSLISCESDADHNRSVITLAGSPEAMVEAAFRIYVKAAELIDLNTHSGEHPRMGAVDVCPFIPVKGVTMADCADLARQLGERVGANLGIPVYLYEAAASRPERKNLADIRKGQFEKLKTLIGKDESRVPDFGPNKIHPTFGCTAIGARFFLVAYNVNLDSDNIELAKEIGKKIREKDGGMPGVKAMGFEIQINGKTYGQVSMNLVDYRKTSPAQAYRQIEVMAGEAGVEILESELIGVIPQDAMNLCAGQALKLKGYSPKMVLENNLEGGDYMQGVNAFLDDLASANPTPGGGAAAAVLGGIGCALASMVANLTIGKKKYAAVEAEARSVLVAADTLRVDLVNSYKEDVAAFEEVMGAFGLPKDTDEQKEARLNAIQQALKNATLTPLKCARLALQGLDLAKSIAEIGNTNAISDAGVASLSLHAAVQAATMNMRINLGSIKDAAFVTEHQAIVADLEAQAGDLAAKVREMVLGKMV